MERPRPLPLAVLLAAALALPLHPAAAQRDSPCSDREPTGATAVVAGPGEPGPPLVITGRVVAGPERRPVAGARVLLFQTDAEGYYSPGGMDERNARLCGVLESGADGAYRVETIRPAPYATGGPPAHVHWSVTLPDGTRRSLLLQFADDPRLAGREADPVWGRVRPLSEEDGVLRVERDLWVE